MRQGSLVFSKSQCEWVQLDFACSLNPGPGNLSDLIFKGWLSLGTIQKRIYDSTIRERERESSSCVLGAFESNDTIHFRARFSRPVRHFVSIPPQKKKYQVFPCAVRRHSPICSLSCRWPSSHTTRLPSPNLNTTFYQNVVCWFRVTTNFGWAFHMSNGITL